MIFYDFLVFYVNFMLLLQNLKILFFMILCQVGPLKYLREVLLNKKLLKCKRKRLKDSKHEMTAPLKSTCSIDFKTLSLERNH